MNKFRSWMGAIALALSCIMVGAAMGVSLNATAEDPVTTIVHTSPFTAAISQVRDSVVGVSNYQKVTYGNYSNNYGIFGFGYGYGYGDSYGGRSQEPETREELASSGSGVVIGDGFVVTNYHVVEDASSLKVTVTDDAGESLEYAASLVAYDENIDVAILYAPDIDLPAVALGNSDALMVGDWAICIGNPLGFTKTSTVGTVSALNRGVESEAFDKYGRKETITNAMIQVDAAINSGNSGGGMFSVTGELMGIPTLKYTGSIYSGATVEGIGMCIPINSVKPLIEKVLSGEIKAVAPETKKEDESKENTSSDLTGKPRLGVSISNLNTSNYAVATGQVPKGVYISAVEENSPAQKAGMQVADIVVEINGERVTSSDDFIAIVGKHDAGDVLTIKLFRAESLATGKTNGEYIDLEVTLAYMESDPVG